MYSIPNQATKRIREAGSYLVLQLICEVGESLNAVIKFGKRLGDAHVSLRSLWAEISTAPSVRLALHSDHFDVSGDRVPDTRDLVGHPCEVIMRCVRAFPYAFIICWI